MEQDLTQFQTLCNLAQMDLITNERRVAPQPPTRNGHNHNQSTNGQSLGFMDDIASHG